MSHDFGTCYSCGKPLLQNFTLPSDESWMTVTLVNHGHGSVNVHHKCMAPTPDPDVMRDYIDRLTRFYIDNPEWVRLANEARGYIGALADPERPTGPYVATDPPRRPV